MIKRRQGSTVALSDPYSRANFKLNRTAALGLVASVGRGIRRSLLVLAETCSRLSDITRTDDVRLLTGTNHVVCLSLL